MHREPSGVRARLPRVNRLRLFGLLMTIAGIVIAVAGYWNRADTQTCAAINAQDRQLGEPATCSSSPPTALLVTATVIGLAGLLIVVNARRRSAP